MLRKLFAHFSCLLIALSCAPVGICQQTSAAEATKTTNRPKIGLALGGGGTRGAAHVGVLRVLKEEGIPIDYISGTSIGAIVGGLYSAGVSVDTLEEKFLDCSLMKAFMTVPLSVRLIAAPVMLIPRVIGFHPYDGLYRGNKFRKYLIKSAPEHERNIEDLHIPFSAISLNIVDGKPFAITSGSLGYALQASSAVPGLRKPVQIGQRLLVDGGVVDNIPVDQAKAMGADFVIAVDVDERLQEVPLNSFRKIGSVSKRMLLWDLAYSDAPSLAKADFVIHPDVDGIGLISRHKRDAVKGLTSGERAAREAMPQLKAKLALLGIYPQPSSLGQRQPEKSSSANTSP